MSPEVNHTSGGQSAIQKQQGTHLLLTAAIALLICSVAINVLLARRVAALNGTLLYLKAENKLSAGASVPPINAKDIDGNAASVSYTSDGIPTVLYVFSPQCKWCEKNIPSIKSFADQVHGKYRLVGMSLSSDGLRSYVAQNGFAFPILDELPPYIVTSYKLGGTPQTIVVSDEGKVLKDWSGAYFGGTKKEIEEYFHVRLPNVDVKASR